MFKTKNKTVSVLMLHRHSKSHYAHIAPVTGRRTILTLIGIVVLLISSIPEIIPVNSAITSTKTKKHIIIDAGHGPLSLCFKTSN